MISPRPNSSNLPMTQSISPVGHVSKDVELNSTPCFTTLKSKMQNPGTIPE